MKTPEELVDAFAQSMKDELKANKEKGDWREWKDSTEIYDELNYHMHKLYNAMHDNNFKAIKEHAADCGNFLLMIGNAYSLYD